MGIMFVFKGEVQLQSDQWSLPRSCHRLRWKIKRCYLTSVQKARLPLKTQAFFLLSNTFSVYISPSGPPTLVQTIQCYVCLRKTYTKLTQRLLYQYCPPHCWAVDAHSFAPPHTTFEFSVRRAFVVSEGRSCSHGNVLGVRWLLLDTSRENRQWAQHHHGF